MTRYIIVFDCLICRFNLILQCKHFDFIDVIKKVKMLSFVFEYEIIVLYIYIFFFSMLLTTNTVTFLIRHEYIMTIYLENDISYNTIDLFMVFEYMRYILGICIKLGFNNLGSYGDTENRN